MQKIDEIAGEKHRRAIIVDTALREYIERHEAKPKRAVKAAPDAKAKATAKAKARART
jgi:hypothetical protein